MLKRGLLLLLTAVLLCLNGSAGRQLYESSVTAKPLAAANRPSSSARLQQQPLDPGYAVSRPTFVVYGDSITEFGYNGPSGWVTLLSQYYSRKADVVNRGMSGWNTRWAAEVLPTTLAEIMPQQDSSNSSDNSKPELWNPKVQLLVIWFGANDAVAPTGKDGYLAVPLDEYKRNLADMVSTARDAGVPNILLITPPPVNETTWAKQQNRNVSDRTTAQARKYANTVKALGSELSVPVLDIHTLVAALPAEEKAVWAIDGLHPSASGQAMVFRALKEALDNWGAFAGIRQSVLPLHWPAFNQVNYQNPQQTFEELFEKERVVPDE